MGARLCLSGDGPSLLPTLSPSFVFSPFSFSMYVPPRVFSTSAFLRFVAYSSPPVRFVTTTPASFYVHFRPTILPPGYVGVADKGEGVVVDLCALP